MANKELSAEKKALSSTDIWYIYNDFYGRFSDFMTLHRMKEEEISVSEYIIHVDNFLASYTIEG